MTQHFWPKLLSFLLPALAAVGFLVWWLSPTQQVQRAAEGVIDATEVRLLGTETPREQTERFVALLTDPVTVEIEGQVDRDEFSRDDAADFHRRLQQSVTSARISAGEAEIRFPAEKEAEYAAPLEVQVRLGQNFERVYRFRATFKFRKTGKNWLLSEVSAVLR